MGKTTQAVLGDPLGRYVLFLVVVAGTFGLLRSSFAEKTGWAYFSLVVLALIPLALFLTNRRVVHLVGLAVIALLMGEVYLLDRYQETDREQVLRKADELLRAVERADLSVFEEHVASGFHWQNMDRKALLARARQSLHLNERRSCGISAARVKGENGAPSLLVEGNLSASGQFGSQDGTFLGLIELVYSRQPNGQYQVTAAKVSWPNGTDVSLPP